MRGRKAPHTGERGHPAITCLDCTDAAEAIFAGRPYCPQHALYHLVAALVREAKTQGEPMEVGAGAIPV